MKQLNEIQRMAKANKHKYHRLMNLILKYDHIAIFRHVRPDFDALGTQMALYVWIRDNFPTKDVVYLGDNSDNLMPKCFPLVKYIDDDFFDKNNVLGIVVDTSDKNRISDDRYKKCSYIIKIDHHPETSRYGRLQIVDDSLSAAGELVANILLSDKDTIVTRECASYLYKAIAGDSNRFLYDSVTKHTFEIAEELLKSGIRLSEIYQEMYSEDISSLDVLRYILENYKITEHGVAYYILDAETLRKFNIKPERGKDNINLFDHFNNIHAWCSFSEDEKEDLWRVSIRSSRKPINKIAERFHGGGHAQASGAKVRNRAEIDKLLLELDKLFIEE